MSWSLVLLKAYHLLLHKTNLDINFNDMGLALLSIGIIFPIFDKLTEKTIGDFEELKDDIIKGLKEKSLYDVLISQIDAKIETLHSRFALREFRNIIALSLGFLLLSICYNTYPIAILLIVTVICLIVLVIILFYKINKRIRERHNDMKLIKDCLNCIEDPVQALRSVLLRDNK